jgi:PHD/YefM family antitoxin component YafN of YafNO toxin-antitoxin module
MAERGYLAKPITIDRPMVLIPAKEYRNLLREAGYLKTPKLDREITQARARFRKGKVIKWETLKSELR